MGPSDRRPPLGARGIVVSVVCALLAACAASLRVMGTRTGAAGDVTSITVIASVTGGR